MKTCFTVMTALLVMFCHATLAMSDGTMLIVNKLDANVVTRGLSLEDRQDLKSSNGRARQEWQIKGKHGHFEVIGDNQKDADTVGWSCAESDKNGALITDIQPKTFCHQFFVKVLSNVVDQPEPLATRLLAKAREMRPQSAVERFGDICIDTDGESCYLRRVSRIRGVKSAP